MEGSRSMRSQLSFLLAGTVFISQAVFAGVTITGTRIIFPSNQKAVTVQLNNPLKEPALVQAWIDNGDPNKIPDADQVPFILTPPLTQIEGNKGQMVRLMAKSTEVLPKDRESLYWFNILDVPPSTVENSGVNKLNVSVRSRIKLIYRPIGLKSSLDEAFTSLRFLYSNQQIEIKNPSPYYINFLNIEFIKDDQKKIYSDYLMIEPFKSVIIQPKLNFKPKQLTYTLINDYGANQPFTTTLEK